MHFKTVPYQEYLQGVPCDGHHILALQTEDHLLVYQAFNKQIADYAIEHQQFGGSHYRFSRMTWIKPNFLWMMHRCGWALKENQECVLGIWMTKAGFTRILEEAVYSSFHPGIYSSRDIWKAALRNKNVRLQWDPDHNIHGEKQERRAIQLGLKGEMVWGFNQTMIKSIIDLTEFVKQQKILIDQRALDKVLLPKETIFWTTNKALNEKLNLTPTPPIG